MVCTTANASRAGPRSRPRPRHLLAALALVGVGAAAAGPLDNPLLDPAQAEQVRKQKGIYGRDDRIERYQATPAGQAAATVIASFILPQALERTERGWRIRERVRIPLRDQQQLCADERFAEQPAVAYCSGFLIDADLLATAGHCVGGHMPPCDRLTVVFDYALTGAAAIRLDYPETDVYRCRELVTQRHETLDEQTFDWAVIRLDRPVRGRDPVIVWGEEPPVDEELVVIGHPMGLPMKIAGGGHLVQTRAEMPTFRSDLDTYHGNSGSAVFTLSSIQQGAPEVIGILVAGAPDLNEGPADCRRSQRCERLDLEAGRSEACSGEWVTKTRWMLRALPKELIEPVDAVDAGVLGSGRWRP